MINDQEKKLISRPGAGETMKANFPHVQQPQGKGEKHYGI